MKTVVLAGGLGTRLSEETTLKPKPMVEIGGLPILWHILKIYATHGFNEFVIALGYRAEVVKMFFLDYFQLKRDLTVQLGAGHVDLHDGSGDDSEDWTVHLIDTGLETSTGGRVWRLRDALGGSRFMLTYGDGIGDVDIGEVVRFHERHGRLATVTAVRPPARFGALELDGERVASFEEKPQLGEGWINGGFFVLEPGVFDYLAEDTIFEHEPLAGLAADGQLMAYRHEGFWQGMDTLRDLRQLNALWETGEAPWATWKRKS